MPHLYLNNYRRALRLQEIAGKGDKSAQLELEDIAQEAGYANSLEMFQSINSEFIKLKELAKEFEKVTDELERIRNQYPELFRMIAIEEVSGSFNAKKEKRGRSLHTDEERLAAVMTWEALDPAIDGTTKYQFLESWFGVNPDGSLSVPETTFDSWREKFRKKGILE